MKYLLFILITTITFSSSLNLKEIMKINISSFKNDVSDYLSVNIKNKEGWHSYWTNPGDAGLPTKITFFDNEKETAIDLIEWPTPHRFLEEGNLTTYAFINLHSFIYKLPPNLNINFLRIEINAVLCKNVCIPIKKIMSGSIKNGHFKNIEQRNEFELEKKKLLLKLKNLPQKITKINFLDIELIKYNNSLALIYSIKEEGYLINSKENILTPYPQEPFSFKKEELFKDSKGNIYGRMIIDWDGEFLEPEVPLPTDGKFKKKLYIEISSKIRKSIEDKFYRIKG